MLLFFQVWLLYMKLFRYVYLLFRISIYAHYYISDNLFASFLKSLVNLLQYCFCVFLFVCLFFNFGHEACGILTPYRESNPYSPYSKS